MKKDAVINLRIDSELKRKLQEKCHDKRLKMTEAIEQAIEQWLYEDSTQSIQSTQDNESATTQVSCDRTEINQLKETNAQLEERLARLENTLQTIDSEGLSALLTASNTIEHGKSLAHQNQSKIASLEHSVDELLENQSNNANLAQRVEKLEKRQSENYQAIAKLQETYEPYVTDTKQLKEAVRELKYDTQALKINRASMTDIRNLEVVLEQKIDSQQLDERLAMATMPIWETIDSNQNKAQQPKTAIEEQLNAVKPNNTAPKESEPTLDDPAFEHLRQQKLNQWKSSHEVDVSQGSEYIEGIAKLALITGIPETTLRRQIKKGAEQQKSRFSLPNKNKKRKEQWKIVSSKETKQGTKYTFQFVKVCSDN